MYSPWTYTWIGMQGIKIKGYLQRTSLFENLVVHYGDDQQLKLCHEKMAEADKLPKNRDLMLNRSYLHRIFKSFTNVSIQSYLLDYRIRQACILLKDTEMSIHVISRSVSYADPLYFSRLFHQKMGMTPSNYRKKNQKKEC